MAAQLPQRLTLTQMQQQWAALLNQLLTNPFLSGSLLTNIQLTPGDNVINHKLGRKQQGWVVTDNNEGDIDLYRNAPFNDLTLTLNCSESAVISLWVF